MELNCKGNIDSIHMKIASKSEVEVSEFDISVKMFFRIKIRGLLEEESFLASNIC